MRTNFHTHTFRCGHAVGTELDYINSAIQNGLGILGFSDHGPFPDKQPGYRMAFSEFQTYLDNIIELKRDFRKQITIYSGVEIEYDPQELGFYEKLLGKYDLDYLALGQHMYISKTGKEISVRLLEDTSLYIDYAISIAEALKSGYFSYVVHPDFMFVNDFPWDQNCDRACEIIIDAAVTHKAVLELNANGVRKGMKRYCDGFRPEYPHPKFWLAAAQAGVQTIVGADCHRPEEIWDKSVEETYAAAREWNLKLTDTIQL